MVYCWAPTSIHTTPVRRRRSVLVWFCTCNMLTSWHSDYQLYQWQQVEMRFEASVLCTVALDFNMYSLVFIWSICNPLSIRSAVSNVQTADWILLGNTTTSCSTCTNVSVIVLDVVRVAVVLFEFLILLMLKIHSKTKKNFLHRPLDLELQMSSSYYLIIYSSSSWCYQSGLGVKKSLWKCS